MKLINRFLPEFLFSGRDDLSTSDKDVFVKKNRRQGYTAILFQGSLFLIIIGLAIYIFLLVNTVAFNKNKLPQIILWVWERPENLLFINDQNIGAAFLAGSVVFTDTEIILTPRKQPLSVNPETKLISVVRIDNLIKNKEILLTDYHFYQTADFIRKVCSQKNTIGCQIDFDAKKPEIDFYKKLIKKIRKEIPAPAILSITALVSWCDGTNWLRNLPIDEAVPMFYQMGPDDYLIRRNLVGKSFMRAKMCQKSIGISTDEPLPDEKYIKNRRIYIFNSERWNNDNFSDIMGKVESFLN